MHIITRKRILEFVDTHPEADQALDRWYRIVKRSGFESFSDLRLTFPSADLVGRLTVFNIGGNKFRLVAFIVYEKRSVYIRNILTHNEYTKGKWKN